MYEAVVVGASAGGIDAIAGILRELPANFLWPILTVLHVNAQFHGDFANLFSKSSKLPVTEGMDKQPIVAGHVYFAPPGYHLLVEQDRSLALSVDEPVHWARPSIDVLFETAALAYGPHLIGIVLSGANHDGAAGLQMIREHGGLAVVQEPGAAGVATMPRMALNKAGADHVLAPGDIGRLLFTLSQQEPGGYV